MTNDFDAVRAYLDFWGEHPRRGKALAALERIEAALRVFAEASARIHEKYQGEDMFVPVDFIVLRPSEIYDAIPVSAFRTAAARFAETAEGEGR